MGHNFNYRIRMTIKLCLNCHALLNLIIGYFFQSSLQNSVEHRLFLGIFFIGRLFLGSVVLRFLQWWVKCRLLSGKGWLTSFIMD